MEVSTFQPASSLTPLQQIHSDVLKLGEEHLLASLQKWLNEELAFVHQAQQQAEQFYQQAAADEDTHTKATLIQAYSEQTLRLLESRYFQPKASPFADLFSDYLESFGDYLLEVSTSERRDQPEERFVAQAEDRWLIRLAKLGKRKWRWLNNGPIRVKNQARKWLKKPPQPITPWQYNVPLKKLVRLSFQENLMLTMLPVVEEAYRVITKTSRILWQVQSQLHKNTHRQLVSGEGTDELAQESWETYQAEFDLAKWQLQNYATTLPQSLNSIFTFQLTVLERDYELAGTMELPTYRFREARLQRLSENNQSVFLKKTQGWATTLFALHDDWRLDQELNLVKDELWLVYFKWIEDQHQGLHKQILPQTDRMSEIIQESLEHIGDEPEEELKRVLRQERKAIDQQLINELIPVITSVMHEQGFAIALNQFKETSETAVEKIADQRGLVASDAYDQPLKISDIAYVSPCQLAEYEMLPLFKKSLTEIQQQTRRQVSDIQKLVQEIGQISYFSLDSAISVYGQESETSEEPRQVAEEGLKRSLTNAERLHEQLQVLVKFQETELQKSIQDFSRKLTELKDNHYVLELKLRLARARATEKAKVVRQKAFRHARLAIPRSARFITQKYQEGAQKIGFYRKQIGIEAGGEVTTEVSDFLAETEAAVNRLPYVYQRLFSVKPLKESVFYRERPEVMVRLGRAFDNWKRGYYANTVLVGQKGSGLTTLIRFFLDSVPRTERREYEVIQSDADQQIYNKGQFLAFFQDQLSPENPFTDVESIINYLQATETRYILIVEHLDHFYLKKVGGFQCLKWLLELISRTHRQVFWLMSCTQYAWDYLDKTVQVADHFEYIVQLPAAKAEVVREIILKRHRVSGYDVQYAPAEEDLSSKKFQKMDEAEQQVFLGNEYFHDLSRITLGNFAIALLYWLRSAQDVTDNQITIGSLKSLDYSFLKSLSVPQIAILHALLLHDGLTAVQFSELSGREKTQSSGTAKAPSNLQLIQLLDDGLLIKSGEVYQIHPLLYQQVVDLLQTRNFVH
ncbi:hypothetical protein [Tunicatimonas pelagia]|uniref:hypothetical protein n=1 Tax=Tunicatimonas pelagia TaxID=931531 RepID=UPI0026652E5F|nr:hypothetical protein [Tunicatimonas pelagia]WKN43995.1 hypothetical protein P0M28_03285 [Tunicatimonas pelagia]